MSDIVVIFHANCTDGLAAAGCAYQIFADTAEYIPMHYDQEPDLNRFTNKLVYILDFSFKRNIFNAIVEVAKRVVMLDHHKTAFEEFAGNNREHYTITSDSVEVLLDNNRSGALLAWNHFNPLQVDNAPLIIRAIDDRDRWQFKLDKTKEINEGLRFVAHTVKDYALAIEDDDVDTLIRIGSILVVKTDQQVKGTMKNARIAQDENGHKFAIVNCPSSITSELGNTLCKELDIDYALMYTINEAERKTIYSLRSVAHFDVSEIAKKRGGGGHKNAAGYVVKDF